VLYELLTGRRAFYGSYISETLAAVLRAAPDWNALPPETPPPLRRLLRRCLEKDLHARLRDIGDARFEFEEPAGMSPATARARTAVTLPPGQAGDPTIPSSLPRTAGYGASGACQQLGAKPSPSPGPIRRRARAATVLHNISRAER